MPFFGLLNSNKMTVNLGIGMGKTLITGDSIPGKATVLDNYIIDALNNNCGVVLFRNNRSTVNAYSVLKSPKGFYSIDCSENAITSSIDIFGKLNERDICSYILKIFDSYSEITADRKMKYLNYIMLMRDLIKKSGKKNIKLNELANYSIEDLEDLNLKYVTNPSEQLKNDRLFGTIRSEIIDLESYFSVFANNEVGEIFSGTNSMEQIFTRNHIIEVNLDFAVKQPESEVVMSCIVDTISRCSIAAAGKNNIAIVVDGVPNDSLIKSGIDRLIAGGKDYNVAYVVEDISTLSDKSNSWIDFADTYLFFKQTSTKNKEYCSLFFDTYEKQKITHNTSHTSPTFFSAITGRGGASNTSGTTRTTEKERVYLPEVFSLLPDNTAIYFDKRIGKHCRLTVYK